MSSANLGVQHPPPPTHPKKKMNKFRIQTWGGYGPKTRDELVQSVVELLVVQIGEQGQPFHIFVYTTVYSEDNSYCIQYICTNRKDTYAENAGDVRTRKRPKHDI